MQCTYLIGNWRWNLPAQAGIKNSRSRAGFTMVETLVAIGVLGIFFAATASILQQVLLNVGESRVRSVALTLAQTKMEQIRNLPYNQLGTQGGIPQGTLAQTENATINSQVFTIKTSIVYIDDPFDGVIPNDLINTDYKRARIEVTWGGTYPSRFPVTIVTNIVPKGVESVEGGGTLVIRVFDSIGAAVPNATVQIDNTQITPNIHIQTLTDTQGYVVLPGAPACVTCYTMSATKTGYSLDKTYSTTEAANPLQPLATVIEGQITQLSFAIDVVSSIRIISVAPAPGYGPVTNVLFTLRGAKIIGYTTNDDPVYKYTFSTNTGGGSVDIPSLEWDTYTLDFTNSAHNNAGSNPVQPFALAPATNKTINFVAIPKTNTSLLVIAQNAASELQASASARLTNLSLSYDATRSAAATGSADFGQAFFGGLTPGTYDLLVTLPGYQEATASFNLSGINQQTVTLNLAQ